MVEIELISKEPVTLWHRPEMELALTVLWHALGVLVLFAYFRRGAIAGPISAWLEGYTDARARSPEQQAKIRDVGQQLGALQRVQAGVSPTAELAAYFRLERQIRPLKEEYDRLVGEASSRNPYKPFIPHAVDAAVNVLTLILLHLLPLSTLVCIPANAFWPLSWMLRFPRIFSSSDDVCPVENADGGLGEMTEVSLVAFIYLAILFADRTKETLSARNKVKSQ